MVAAGTNPVDAKLRANGSSAGLEAPIILGADISGVVEEVGPGVTDLAPGEEVYYTPEVFGPRSNGSYAEYHVAKADIVAKKPATISHEEAAACRSPEDGLRGDSEEARRTGWGDGPDPRWSWRSRVFRRSDRQGSRCSCARHGGFHNQEILKELGADVAIDYKSQDVREVALDDTGEEGVDTVFDTVGGGTIVESIPATKNSGRLATILGAQGDLTALYQKNQTLYGVFLSRERARLEEMSTLIERGQVRPLVAEVLPLEEVGKPMSGWTPDTGAGK